MKRKANTKRAPARRRTTKAPPGFHIPMRVIPLQVYAAWKTGDWSMMNEEKVYFNIGYDCGRVKQLPRQHQPSHLHQDLGPLPDGWSYATISHNESDDSELFVGPKAMIDELKKLQTSRDASDDQIGKLIHGDN